MTGMLVARERISVSMLSCLGSRCWTRTKAVPGLAGSAPSIAASASRPPAEAPTPTIGKELFFFTKRLAGGLPLTDLRLAGGLDFLVSLGTAHPLFDRDCSRMFHATPGREAKSTYSFDFPAGCASAH